MDSLDPKTFGKLAAALADSSSIEETVDHVVSFAVETLGTEYGGITLLRGGRRRLETVGATHDRVLEADVRQYTLDEGPCVEASTRTRGVLTSPSLRHDPRWPRWGPSAAELGFHSIISAPMLSRGQHIGAINLYGAHPAGFTQDDLETAEIFAHQAAVALGYARVEEGLLEAVRSRTVIGQAQGILMHRFDIEPDKAFGVLRRYSQDSNRRLRDVAGEIVESRRPPAGDAGTPSD